MGILQDPEKHCQQYDPLCQDNNNNNNNKKIYLAPISSENPSSVAQPCTKSRQPMDLCARKLRRIDHFEKIGFQITAK